MSFLILNFLFLLHVWLHLSYLQTSLICKLSSKPPGNISSLTDLFSLSLSSSFQFVLLHDIRGWSVCFGTSTFFPVLSLSFISFWPSSSYSFLFLLMWRAFPGEAAAEERRCLAIQALGAAAEWAGAASGVWGWEGASAGGAPSKRTQWRCKKKSLLLRLPLPAPHLWSLTWRSIPAPQTNRWTRHTFTIIFGL